MFETTRPNGVLRIFNHLLRISTLIIIGCPTMNNGSYVCAKCVIKRQNIFLFFFFLLFCFTSYITYVLNILCVISAFTHILLYKKKLYISHCIGWAGGGGFGKRTYILFPIFFFVMNARNVIFRFYN